MPSKEIRLVQPADSARILEIYRPYVETSAVSFEVMVPSVQAFQQRVEAIAREYPFIVFLSDGEIAGYAYGHRHMERAAYQWNATLSVYIDVPFQGQGIGSQLYLCLMEILKLQHVHTVYGIVTHPNPKSERLHEALGFEKIGVFRKTGYKQGAWHDVTWFEKSILPYTQAPQPFIPISAVDAAAIAAVLTRYSSV
ncbi:MAG: hypothetical protein PWQ55_2674 [Chloroflexota bacterium]|nr:hypothetical protein [Chloroflexota bacterium]